MSLKSFIKGIIDAIGNLFRSMKKEAKKAVEFGVNAVNWLKNQDAENPQIADLITTLIPGTKDDDFKNKIRESVPKILVQLNLVQDTLGKTDEEILKEGIKALQALTAGPRTVFLHGLSVLLAEVYADGKLDLKDLLIVQKWYYDHQNDDDVDTNTDSDGDGIPDKDEVK